MRRELLLVTSVALLSSGATAVAQGVITDGNARWEFNNDPGVPGSADFEPDGGGAVDDNLTQNWWWFRITSGPGFATFERPLAWPAASQSYVGNVATLGDSEASFDWELSVMLLDEAQAGNARIIEELTLTNTTDEFLNITIFNYVNFAVGADELDDTAVQLGPAHVGFFDDDLDYSAEIEGPGGVAFEVAPVPILLNSLNDSTITQATNGGTPAGPGDLAAVVEYQVSVSPGGVVSVSELLEASLVPEPSALALLAVGAAAILRRRRR